MENQSKLHSVKITKLKWKLLLLSFTLAGLILFSFSSLGVPSEYIRQVWFGSIGGGLIGLAAGLVYARVFKIQGIDK